MGENERVPALPLIACVLAGPIPAALLPALAGSGDVEGFLRVWATLALFGFCYAVAIGLPIALLLLRDPALPWHRWMGAGVLAGMVTTAVVLGWTALTSARHLVDGQWQAFQVLMLWLVVPLVLLSAIVSRIALGFWLHRRAIEL